jgi:hypothetical protein
MDHLPIGGSTFWRLLKVTIHTTGQTPTEGNFFTDGKSKQLQLTAASQLSSDRQYMTLSKTCQPGVCVCVCDGGGVTANDLLNREQHKESA